MTLVKFTMHDAKEMIVEIENYDAEEVKNIINNKTNGEDIVAFGGKGFSKYAVKYFEPIVEE